MPPPCKVASNPSQLSSLAELPKRKKYPKYGSIDVNEGNRQAYFEASCFPITVTAEDDMELLSELYTNEELCHFWGAGIFKCAKCDRALYNSSAKFKGPCRWASFRQGIDSTSLELRVVSSYNNYTVEVAEVYCGGCKLFIGHQFEDGPKMGDSHPDARYRH